MRKVKVVFTRPKKFSLISKIFQWIEDASFSHVALYIYSSDLINFYTHVTHQNVHVNTKTYFEKKYEIVEEISIDVNDQDFDYMIKEMSRYEGAHYGYLTILGIGLSRLAKFFGIRVKNIFKDKNNSFFCSEYIWYLITIMMIDVEGFDEELDGPKKLFETLRKKYD